MLEDQFVGSFESITIEEKIAEILLSEIDGRAILVEHDAEKERERLERSRAAA